MIIQVRCQSTRFGKAALILGLTTLLASAAWAGVTYDAKANRIVVDDYLESAPATLDTLLQADQAGKWGKVSYDQATDTYRVEADLWIGTEKSISTFFQIGRKDHPKETLIMKGNLSVSPSKEAKIDRRTELKRTDGRLAFVNRLTLGSPTDDSLQPTLKFDCSKKGEFGIMVGHTVEGKRLYRGEFHAYHTLITALTQDDDHMVKGGAFSGNDIRLIGCTLSWIDGTMCYGLQAGNGTVEGTTFEHGGAALYNGVQVAKNCKFRFLGTGVSEGGSLSATLINCVFEANDHNWTHSSCGYGVVAIDCKFGPQKQPLQFSPAVDSRTRRKCYPIYAEKKRIIVQVVDSKGKAVPGAAVDITCEQGDPTAIDVGFAVTDEKGMTPEPDDERALLITARRLRAVDPPGEPTEEKFTYLMKIIAQGHRTEEVKGIDAQKIFGPMKVVLSR